MAIFTQPLIEMLQLKSSITVVARVIAGHDLGFDAWVEPKSLCGFKTFLHSSPESGKLEIDTPVHRKTRKCRSALYFSLEVPECRS